MVNRYDRTARMRPDLSFTCSDPESGSDALQKAKYNTSLLGAQLNAYGDLGDGFLLPKGDAN